MEKFVLTLVGLAIGIALAAQDRVPSWPQWRGPGRDGTVPLTVPVEWPATLTRRWEAIVGAGHSSPVIAGDRVVQHARQGELEVTRAFDLATGKEIWRQSYAAPYTMNRAARGHGPGPKSTPVVDRGRVFTFGISGILSAHDVITGAPLWRAGAPGAPPEFGTAMSPIVEGGLVIAHLGAHDRGALTAFDAASGEVRWRWTGDGPAYASPVVMAIDGVRQIVTQTENALIGVNARTGQALWQVPFRTSHDQNSITPVVVKDTIVYSGLDSGTTAARVVRKGASWALEPLWRNEQVSMYMSSPVAAGGTLYGLSHRNRGQLFALDLATGKTLWTTPGRDGENASVMAAESLLLVATTNAELIIARASRERFDEITRYTVADSAVWAHPAIAGSLVLIKDVDKLICWQIGSPAR